MSDLISDEVKSMVGEITELRDKAMVLDRAVARILVPKANAFHDSGDKNSIKQMINELPACNTRMTLAGIHAKE
jgi:hypothetical protein